MTATQCRLKVAAKAAAAAAPAVAAEAHSLEAAAEGGGLLLEAVAWTMERERSG